MTVMSVGRCATCGEVTGEVVPAGEELTKTYCPTCEPIQFNPTRAGTRPGRRVPRFTEMFEEATLTTGPPTTFGVIGHVDPPTNPFANLETNENDEVLCPMCGGNEFSWEGNSTHREMSYVVYRTRFYGHVYADGVRQHEDYDREDIIRDETEESNLEDTEYDNTEVICCDNCGHRMGGHH